MLIVGGLRLAVIHRGPIRFDLFTTACVVHNLWTAQIKVSQDAIFEFVIPSNS